MNWGRVLGVLCALPYLIVATLVLVAPEHLARNAGLVVAALTVLAALVVARFWSRVRS